MWKSPFNPRHLARMKKKEYDYIAYFAVGLSILFTVPQTIHVYVTQSAQDIVLITWVGSLFISVFWLIYGIERKAKPVIVSSISHMSLTSLMIYAIVKFGGILFF